MEAEEEIVATKSTAEVIGEKVLDSVDTLAHEMKIPTAALIAIIIGNCFSNLFILCE